MLQHAERLREAGDPGQPAAQARQPVGDLVAQLRLAASNLERQQPSRSQIRAELLRPGHNLPTRSLREQVRTLCCWLMAGWRHV